MGAESLWLHSFLTSPLNISFQICTQFSLYQGEVHAKTYVPGFSVSTRKSLVFSGNRTKFLSRSSHSLVTVPTTLSPLVFPCGTSILYSGRRLIILLLSVTLARRRLLSCAHSYIKKITVLYTQLHREDYSPVHIAT